MINFSIDSDKLVARFDTVTDNIIKKTKEAADTGAVQVRAQAYKLVERVSPGSRDGIRRGNKEVKIAPKGQPPNSDTGNLARNIKLSTAMGTAMRGKAYFAVVESVARSKKEYNYAKKLEETHPYMAPALKKSEKTIRRLFKNAVKID